MSKECEECGEHVLDCWCIDINDKFISKDSKTQKYIRQIIEKAKCQHTKNMNEEEKKLKQELEDDLMDLIRHYQKLDLSSGQITESVLGYMTCLVATKAIRINQDFPEIVIVEYVKNELFNIISENIEKCQHTNINANDADFVSKSIIK